MNETQLLTLKEKHISLILFCLIIKETFGCSQDRFVQISLLSEDYRNDEL